MRQKSPQKTRAGKPAAQPKRGGAGQVDSGTCFTPCFSPCFIAHISGFAAFS